MKKKFIFFFAIVVVSIILAFVIFSLQNNKMRKNSTLFSWEISNENSQVIANFQSKLNINRIFQYINPDEFENGILLTYMSEMKEKKLSVYAMDGGYYWGTTDYGYEELINFVDKVYEYNISHTDNKIEGIVLDVEPASDPEWGKNENAIMKKFVSNMINAYKYADNKDLNVVVCIPNWYDENHKTELGKLIENGCDEIAIMNYSRGNEIGKIETEILTAKKFEKSIISIFEFAKPDGDIVFKQNTYYNEGIDFAMEAFQEMDDYFKYKDLTAGWHELR